jgi:hypothetical protein
MVIEIAEIFYKLIFEDARSVGSFRKFKGKLPPAEMA